jgi:pimeloyl-ACP methyl ester carboxylesterase
VVLLDIIPITYREPTPQDPENTPTSFGDEEEAVDFFLNRFTALTDAPPRRYVEESVGRCRRDDGGRVIALSHHGRRLKLRKDLDLWKCFRRITAPILLVWGEDSELPVEEVRRMRAIKSDMSVIGIMGANHFVPVSHPEEVVKAVESFLL